MRKGSIALVVCALAAASALAGCGGGGEGSDEVSTSSMSRAEFVAKADAVCTRTNQQIERDFGAFAKKTHFSLTKKPTEAQEKGLVNEVLIPGIEREVAKIRALGAPSEEADRVAAFLDAAEEGFETARDLPRVVLENPSVAFGVAGRLAKEYGLGVCLQK